MPGVPETALLVICAVAAVTDWRTGTIPNWLTLPPLVLAPLYFAVTDWPWGAVRSLLGIFICSIVPVVLFWRRAMGGGDVKLLATVGALSGYMLGLEIQLFACGIAGLYALVRLCWDGLLFRTLQNIGRILLNAVLPKAKRKELDPTLLTSIRFGGAIFAAALVNIALRTLTA